MDSRQAAGAVVLIRRQQLGGGRPIWDPIYADHTSVPIRPDRPRIRLELQSRGDRHIVHNYGHSGAGVSLSWGCADDVVKMVLALLR
jgi:hypothetical protein